MIVNESQQQTKSDQMKRTELGLSWIYFVMSRKLDFKKWTRLSLWVGWVSTDPSLTKSPSFLGSNGKMWLCRIFSCYHDEKVCCKQTNRSHQWLLMPRQSDWEILSTMPDYWKLQETSTHTSSAHKGDATSIFPRARHQNNHTKFMYCATQSSTKLYKSILVWQREARQDRNAEISSLALFNAATPSPICKHPLRKHAHDVEYSSSSRGNGYLQVCLSQLMSQSRKYNEVYMNVKLSNVSVNAAFHYSPFYTLKLRLILLRFAQPHLFNNYTY